MSNFIVCGNFICVIAKGRLNAEPPVLCTSLLANQGINLVIVLKHWITNAIVFQSVWFSVFLSISSVALDGSRLRFNVGRSHPQALKPNIGNQWRRCGYSHEYLAIQAGLYSYQDANIIPMWLVVLWFALVLTINQALSRLLSLKPLLLFIIFWLCAPPSYLAAAKVGVIELQLPWWQFWLSFGAIWSAGLLIVKINDALKGTKLAQANANW